MNILIGIETVVLLVVIGTVAEEIGRVVTHLHMTDEPLHIAHALWVSGYVIMQNVDAGFLALHSVLLLSHNELRQQEEQGYYEQHFTFHHDRITCKITIIVGFGRRKRKIP